MINMLIKRADLIIHKLLVWIVFLQHTEELDNVGILFVSQLGIWDYLPKKQYPYVRAEPVKVTGVRTGYSWAEGLRTDRLYRQNIQPEYDRDGQLVCSVESSTIQCSHSYCWKTMLEVKKWECQRCQLTCCCLFASDLFGAGSSTSFKLDNRSCQKGRGGGIYTASGQENRHVI